MTTVALAPVRRWIRRRQAAHLDAGSALGNVYFAALLAAVLIGMFWPTVGAVFWPATPTGTLLTAAGVPLVCAGALHLALRQLGPLAISRPAAAWLLTAPVSRRALLGSSARTVGAVGAAAGAAAGFATASQVSARPAPVGVLLLTMAAGALTGVLLVVSAIVAQRRAGLARGADLLAYLAVTLGAGAMVWERTGHPAAATGRPAEEPVGYAVTALAAAVVVLGTLAYRRLDRTPPDAILAASRAAGTMADAALTGQPSFVQDLAERRFWTSRRWRSTPLTARLPVLTAQDLRFLGRKKRRLAWLAAATLLPAVFMGGSRVLLAIAVLLGAMIAASTTVASIRTDANPAILRLLAVTAREAVIARLWLPVALASAWSAAALALLGLLGGLPPGPWWALGLALGPAAAAAAVRRARMGLVQNGLLPIDTPMGSLETGPLLGVVIGYDLLVLFGLPTLAILATGATLSWTNVLFQAVAAVAGLALYVGASTSTSMTDLRARG